MPLDGVNKKCLDCSKDCKQFKQVKVIFCPNYEKDGCQTSKPAFSTQAKSGLIEANFNDF